MTVNRVCGSGAQAIVTVAQQIATGEVGVAIAGGMENMDRAPYLMDGGRWGYRMGPAEIQDSMLRDGLDDAFSDKHSGWHTEDLVTQAQLTRAAQDRFAERSQQRFSAAQKAGKFVDEIVAIDIRGKKGVEAFATDEAPRPAPHSKRWPNSARHSAKAARSRPATRLRSTAVPPQWSLPGEPLPQPSRVNAWP